MPADRFGALEDGSVVRRLVLGSAPGVVLHLLTLGAVVHRLEVTGGDGVRRNVALGYATAADYLAATDYLGAIIGRYANRIAGGRFALAGREVRVGAHDRGNHLHGGPDGFDRRLWSVLEQSETHAVLGLVSPDGDQGFPGALSARVRFAVAGDLVAISFEATTDATTPVNLTCHAYLNLDGDGAGVIDDHLLQVAADAYTPVDATGIPTGGHHPVAHTPFDFRVPARIGAALRVGDEQVLMARGIDHNFVVRGTGLRTAAVLTSPRTGTRLELRSDQPGVQVYTGNFLDGSRRSSGGGPYRQGDGIALEPQRFPDSPNRPDWPSSLLGPGETYRAEMSWEFTRAPATP